MLEARNSRGRRREYCNATCRSAARRRREQSIVKPGLTPPARQGTLDGVAPLTAIATAQRQLRDAEDAVRACVERARGAGHTWQEIGDILGISRQAAFQRFGRALDPHTGRAMDTVALGDAADRAVALAVDLVAQRWADVCRDFDEGMVEAVTPAALAGIWVQVAGTIGVYERMGEAFSRQIGAYSVVDVPLFFEAGELIARVSYDSAGRVAGLYLLPSTAT